MFDDFIVLHAAITDQVQYGHHENKFFVQGRLKILLQKGSLNDSTLFSFSHRNEPQVLFGVISHQQARTLCEEQMLILTDRSTWHAGTAHRRPNVMTRLSHQKG